MLNQELKGRNKLLSICLNSFIDLIFVFAHWKNRLKNWMKDKDFVLAEKFSLVADSEG